MGFFWNLFNNKNEDEELKRIKEGKIKWLIERGFDEEVAKRIVEREEK